MGYTGTRSEALREAQRRYRLTHKEMINERKRAKYNSEEARQRYNPEQRHKYYVPNQAERRAYKGLRLLFT